MALNSEIHMNKFSEGSTSTGGRVYELTFPVDISHRSWSQHAQANEKDLDLELNLQKENLGAGPSGGRSEDDELVHPVSESRSEAEVEGQDRVTLLEPCAIHWVVNGTKTGVNETIREEEDQDDGAGRTHQPVGDPENTDHTVTVEECRTCGPDEDIPEPDNLLVKLGCHCRGSLSMMHRKCILQWYGPRMCRGNNYKCELCNAVLHGRIEHTVSRALLGHDSGTDILIKAMGLAPPYASVQAPTLIRDEAHDENAHPNSHQINVPEITRGPAQQPYGLAQNRMQNRSSNAVPVVLLRTVHVVRVMVLITLVVLIVLTGFVAWWTW